MFVIQTFHPELQKDWYSIDKAYSREFAWKLIADWRKAYADEPQWSLRIVADEPQTKGMGEFNNG